MKNKSIKMFGMGVIVLFLLTGLIPTTVSSGVINTVYLHTDENPTGIRSGIEYLDYDNDGTYDRVIVYYADGGCAIFNDWDDDGDWDSIWYNDDGYDTLDIEVILWDSDDDGYLDQQWHLEDVDPDHPSDSGWSPIDPPILIKGPHHHPLDKHDPEDDNKIRYVDENPYYYSFVSAKFILFTALAFI